MTPLRGSIVHLLYETCFAEFFCHSQFLAKLQVEQERVKDAASGNMIAVALDGVIQRKIIKQTIMTTVYGVTKFGARLQIAKQLKGRVNHHFYIKLFYFFETLELHRYKVSCVVYSNPSSTMSDIFFFDHTLSLPTLLNLEE